MDEILYKLKSLEKYINLFNWTAENIKLPYNPEYFLTTNGSLGFLINEKMWVIGAFNGLTNDEGEFTDYVWRSLNTGDVKTGTAKNHKDIIVCGNTCLYRGFGAERKWLSHIKSEIDKSIEVLAINTRKSKAFVVEDDRKAKELRRILKDVDEGKPFVVTTSIMEELQVVDVTDPADIEKMQYLTSFYQSIEKREANDAGIDLDLIDKRAQVSNKEIQQYDDVTTQQYLIMFNARQKFVKEMRKNGFNINIERSPIFFDEPTENDVENGDFEAAEEEKGNEKDNQTDINNSEEE